MKSLNSRQQNIQISDLCFTFYDVFCNYKINTIFSLPCTRISGFEIEPVVFLVTIRFNGFEIHREAQVNLVKLEGLDRG